MYRVPTPNIIAVYSNKPVEYRVPINPPYRNPDDRTLELLERNQQTTSIQQTATMGVSMNQTTAIRIDDDNVDVRQSWSSAKINESLERSGKVRIGTTSEWELQPTFVPERGEFIVYTDRTVIDGVAYSGVKIGDGGAYVVDLPFVGDDVATVIVTQINDHVFNSDIHVSPAEKQFWDNKLNYDLQGETLIFDKN